MVMTSSSFLNSQSPAIESRGLGKSFGSRAALEGVDLVVSRGVAFGFLGANGAGKTTLIRLLHSTPFAIAAVAPRVVGRSPRHGARRHGASIAAEPATDRTARASPV
jgi:ABC-type multidrug transport system ATPase subunit